VLNLAGLNFWRQFRTRLSSTLYRKGNFMDQQQVFRGEFAFSYKSCWEHVRDFLCRPIPILAAAVASFGVLWTFGEASIQFTEANPRGWLSYGILIAASVLASFVWNGCLYIRRVPEGFENVSASAQRIAHLQRPLWEFQLAKSLLAQKLAPFESELRDMEAGREFVMAEKPDSLQAYMHWAGTRPDNLFNMLDVAKQLLLNDFPASLQSTPGTPADPKQILSSVNTLGRFYGETVAFERTSRAVMPSEDLKELHKLQYGWSDEIRIGVRQLFQFLQLMCDCNPDGDNHIKFEIAIEESDRVAEFCDMLSGLEDRIPLLASNW